MHSSQEIVDYSLLVSKVVNVFTELGYTDNLIDKFGYCCVEVNAEPERTVVRLSDICD